MTEEEKNTETAETEETVTETKEEIKPDPALERIERLTASIQQTLEDNASLKDALASNQQKLNEIETALKVSQTRSVEIEELDPLKADVPDVIKQNKAMADRIRAYEQRIASLEKMAKEFSATEQTREAERRKAETVERILAPLDERFGAKFRNEAKKLADSLVDSGQEEQPKTELSAFLLMERCYQKVKKDAESKVKPKVAADNGKGTVPYSESDIKEGSIQEVLADMKKRKK